MSIILRQQPTQIANAVATQLPSGLQIPAHLMGTPIGGFRTAQVRKEFIDFIVKNSPTPKLNIDFGRLTQKIPTEDLEASQRKAKEIALK